MKNIKLLDCTLRDGGYVIDSIFGENTISGIINKLCKANVDIVEVGFLKDCEYSPGSTNFTNIPQINKYLPVEARSTMFAAMIDYGRYDIDQLPKCDGKGIVALRNCFFKRDRYDAVHYSKEILKKGYKLFIQPVDILGYSDLEILELIEIANELKPYAFSIVDTFGSMYEEDLVRVFSLLNHNLDKSIRIGFHSHNNLQLSFALSQKIIELSDKHREIIIDTTLCGMGRGAGNTNTELLVNYLNKKYNYGYDINEIMDLIDLHITPIMKDKSWGYSIPYFIAGLYSTHVHNISYLLDKHKVRSKDMQIIIGSLDENIKKRYDYNNLENIYISYFNNEINDEATLVDLSKMLKGKDVLVLAPGRTILSCRELILKYQAEKKDNLLTISVNFCDKNIKTDLLFFSNNMRYDNAISSGVDISKYKTIITSNLKVDRYDYVVNYNNLIMRKYQHFDNAMILLLSLLSKIGCQNVLVAGFDGYPTEEKNSYYNKSFQTDMSLQEKCLLNTEIKSMLQELTNKKHSNLNLDFLTHSMYSKELESSVV